MLEMLANSGWNSVLCFSLDYGLYVMHLSHSNAYDLVFALVLWLFALLSSNCTTKTLEYLFYLIDYWDCVGLVFCSLGTIAGTNIFGAVAGEQSWKPIFPGILIISLVLGGELKPTNLEDCFSPLFHSGY